MKKPHGANPSARHCFIGAAARGDFPNASELQPVGATPDVGSENGRGGNRTRLATLVSPYRPPGGDGRAAPSDKKKNPLFSPFSLFFAKRGENEK